MIIEPGLEYMIPIDYVIDERLASWTEVTEKMNVMEVERLIHAHVARQSQRERVRRSREK